jgi:hypothetical protein
MSNLLARALIVSLTGLWTAANLHAAPPAGPFPDKNLEAAVRDALHEEKAPLTDDKLNNLFVLETNGKDIRSLQGLEKCKNLSLLKLSKAQVADLAPLKDLTNIQSLDLSDNKIVDVTPLAGLTKLQFLELSHNQIVNVAPLGKLVNLSALYAGHNKIADVTPLGSLVKLSSLSLPHNQVKDIAALAAVARLSTLDLNENQVENVVPVAKQTEISLLMLEQNKIADLGPLVPWAKADAEGQKRFAPYMRLYLKGNPLSAAAFTKDVPALKAFGVRIESLPPPPAVQVTKPTPPAGGTAAGTITTAAAGGADLAQVLGMDVRMFEFSGGPLLCWLEVEETGQQTLPKDWGDNFKKNPAQRDKGKVVFAFPDPSLAVNADARFALGYIGDGSTQRLGAAVPDKGLWLGDWKGGRTIKINGPLDGQRFTVERGKDVTLLEITVEENGAAKPHRVKVVLKGRLLPAGKS